MTDPSKPGRPDRRSFLRTVGTGAGAAAVAAQAAAALRSLAPNVAYDGPTLVKVGRQPDGLPDGLTFLPEARLFVFRSGRAYHAISAVCTHLGCTVHPEALSAAEDRRVSGRPMRVTHRFVCSCHGSRYHGDGANESGPAPAPLPWYRVLVSPDDGQLAVDLSQPVPAGRQLTLL
ncbi:MAG TPA: Rieske (2Fe-2S) protein [Vicinamibacterales bacterium]|nr:Rieske (2Fe-2S) protein [Vicinamibacterales bacterium]HPW22207.1 Rieske (2Fe-2S) protein [Vicinamibacterales bacterium]